MSRLAKIDFAPGRTVIAGAPAGLAALVVGELAAAAPAGILHVARDDAGMARMAEALAFFAPQCSVLTFPAWDCLPYDRVSPNPAIAARRLEALTRIADAEPGQVPRIVLTTVNALTQRVPPRASLRGMTRHLKRGDRLDAQDLGAFLVAAGYGRAETVMEPGEFALRGGLVDVFPPGADEPLRVDLFGDEIEAIRRFDPMTQRTTGKADEAVIAPVGEFVRDEASIRRFRDGFLTLFGVAGSDTPLFEAVTAGRRFPGEEHWLPLFHERLETLFDYLPGAVVILDPQSEEARDFRFDQVADHYGARRDPLASGAVEGGAYYPLPPERLHLDRSEWELRMGEHPVLALSPYAQPEAPGVIDVGGRPGADFAEARASRALALFDAVRDRVSQHRQAGRRVVIAGFSKGSCERLVALMGEHGIEGVRQVADWPAVTALAQGEAAVVVLGIESGFVGPGLAVISEQDILGERLIRKPQRKRAAERLLIEASSLNPGDLVVHADHGIGRFDGLETLTVGNVPHDCLRLVYAGGDKVYLPVEHINLLTRFGSDEADVALDRLGGVAWQSRKAKLKARIRDMAAELIAVAAARATAEAPSLTAPAELYDEFCARFPWPETDDQLRAIDDTLADLESGRPMDRLICGDVGFGKTEVALRAAFVVAKAGMQVAVVAPTTLLCRQHFRTFSARFNGFGLRVAQISRLVTARDAAQVKKDLADGKIDIMIGTHALLGKSVTFPRLGLLIVDEEQHFGVGQKERLKKLKANVHVLTLTATPIPRTLQLALAGVRDMSVIATPPVDRLAVRSFVTPFDPVTLRDALMREHLRGGQTFCVCPRIEDLPKVSEILRQLVPEVKIAMAHGRMAPSEIEMAVGQFYDAACGILLSTNIVESGLDIPSANTLVVYRADRFGLAQLYQLRGRVGRSKQRGYAYLTLPPGQALTPAAEKRLDVMQALDSLGAGFTLASHDLDIRGAGNLLGDEQSGHIREVGIELYQQMLEEAVHAARGQPQDNAEEWTPQINVGMPVLIPDGYVADLGVRLGLYRRIAGLIEPAEIESFAAEMIDRFGPLPAEVNNLLETIAIKRLCLKAGVDRIEAGPKGAIVSFRDNRFARPDALVAYLQSQAGTVKLRPDHKLVSARAWTGPRERLQGVRRLIGDLADLVSPEPSARLPSGAE
ncbi:MAG: transcription-repair coupling factor [Alphaproteobacteria bacterium]